MKTQTYETIVSNPNNLVNDNYEIIANQSIINCNQKDLIISGALLLQNTFKYVIFNNCTFFGSKIENCQFIGCQFKNCKFQFSSILSCNFISCKINHCQWETPFLQKNEFQCCSIDHISTYYISKNENHLVNCFSEKLPRPEDNLHEVAA